MRRRAQSETRARILDAARRIYVEQGYDAVSMRGVARQLEFTAQAIYNYFSSKEELFRALAEEGVERLYEAHPVEELADPVANLRLVFWRYYEFSKTSPEFFFLLWVDKQGPDIDWGAQSTRAREIAIDAHRRLQRCVTEGAFREGLDPGRTSNLLLTAVHGPAIMRVLGRPRLPVDMDALAASLLDSALDSLRVQRDTGPSSRTPSAR